MTPAARPDTAAATDAEAPARGRLAALSSPALTFGLALLPALVGLGLFADLRDAPAANPGLRPTLAAAPDPIRLARADAAPHTGDRLGR